MSGEKAQAGQPKLRVEWVPTADLVPYAGNAKIHTDEQISEICESIKQFGFSDPVGAWHDEDGHAVIVEGHGRVMAAHELGLDTVPVVWLDHLDDEGRRAYGLVHNQLTMGTGWDDEALAAELASLADMDLGGMGFDDMLADLGEPGDGTAPAGADGDAAARASLADRFGFVPFSVLDASHGRWLDRKRAWMSIGIRSEVGRGGGLAYQPGLMGKSKRYERGLACRA